MVPPHGLAELFGSQEEHNLLVRNEKLPDDASPDDAIYYQPQIDFTEPAKIRMTARTYLTPIKLTSAKQIASSYVKPLAARKKIGQGEMLYVGTGFGAALLANDAGATELLRSMVLPVAAPEVTAEKVRPRLIRGDGHSLLAVFNDTPRDQPATSSCRSSSRPRGIFIAGMQFRSATILSSSPCLTRTSRCCNWMCDGILNMADRCKIGARTNALRANTRRTSPGFSSESENAQAGARQTLLYVDCSIPTEHLYLIENIGGGGGSRTRVRNPSQ